MTATTARKSKTISRLFTPIATAAFVILASTTHGSPAVAQVLNLPATGVGANLPVGVGYGLANVGEQGPFIIGAMQLGHPAAIGASTPAPAASALPALGPQQARLLVRDAKGVPAFTTLASAKTPIPTLIVRSMRATLTFTNVTIDSVVPAYGAATSPVPIAEVTIHFTSLSHAAGPSSVPATSASPASGS